MFCFKRIWSFFFFFFLPQILPKSFFLVFLLFSLEPFAWQILCMYDVYLRLPLCSFLCRFNLFLSRSMWQKWKWSAKIFLINKVTRENLSKGWKKKNGTEALYLYAWTMCERYTIKQFHFLLFYLYLLNSLSLFFFYQHLPSASLPLTFFIFFPFALWTQSAPSSPTSLSGKKKAGGQRWWISFSQLSSSSTVSHCWRYAQEGTSGENALMFNMSPFQMG